MEFGSLLLLALIVAGKLAKKERNAQIPMPTGRGTKTPRIAQTMFQNKKSDVPEYQRNEEDSNNKGFQPIKFQNIQDKKRRGRHHHHVPEHRPLKLRKSKKKPRYKLWRTPMFRNFTSHVPEHQALENLWKICNFELLNRATSGGSDVILPRSKKDIPESSDSYKKEALGSQKGGWVWHTKCPKSSCR